ncbi:MULTISPECIES: YraN family protein [Carboxydocella]|uniref:UPF0102 protein SAMN02745885_00201 n=2 Tax=Carboxydocella TaxID=178898 RepID=A0A1T4LKU1_9FIRM|nr:MULTISPECIES: YraN family protein [Carboxydocella]AVX20511.1 putative endonuclease [Carboxydocella thermautotrophica]AVX30932.1 putative endonuclease [Carboxydocella thermautotrophica]SJZ55372.1 putative endonuclease [Carboxydocella sporoproducens DSM 16521]
MKKKELGNLGEEIAAQYLAQQGYKIIARNLKLKKGEVDILCKDSENNLVLVEVKTCSKFSPVPAIENITRVKKNRLRRLWQELTSIYNCDNGYIMAIAIYYEGHETNIMAYILD